MQNLSYKIIGKAMEVHSALGPGLDEEFYHGLLADKMREAGVDHEFKPRRHLRHRGVIADTFEPDIVVPDQMVVELKAQKESFAPEHFAQIFSYQKFLGIPQGLLLNFGRHSLEQRLLTFRPAPPSPLSATDLVEQAGRYVEDKAALHEVCGAILRIYQEFGLGYCDTTYRGLLEIEFNATGLGCTSNPAATVRLGARTLGEARLRCLALGRTCALEVLALRDEIYAPDRAVLQTALRHLDLPWGAVVNFGKDKLELNGVTRPKNPV